MVDGDIDGGRPVKTEQMCIACLLFLVKVTFKYLAKISMEIRSPLILC